MRLSFIIAGVALAVGFIVAIYLLREPEAEPSQEVVAEPASVQPAPRPSPEPIEPTPPSPASEPQQPPPVLVPPLNESDEFVRSTFTDTLLPQAWLGKEDLLRRAAVVVDNAAHGEYPRRQLEFMAPDGKFRVREVGEQKFIDPVSYKRYDRYLDMLESVEPAALVDLLDNTNPLLDEALHELGNDQTALPQLVSAIDEILALPVLQGDVELVQPKVLYEYADPELEGLSPLQKQVLRMGPDNVNRLKAYLTEVRKGLLRR